MGREGVAALEAREDGDACARQEPAREVGAADRAPRGTSREPRPPIDLVGVGEAPERIPQQRVDGAAMAAVQRFERQQVTLLPGLQQLRVAAIVGHAVASAGRRNQGA